jgi:hypothetical protein
MKRIITYFFCVTALVLFVNNSSGFAEGGWSLVKNSGGIKVYERAVPGSDLMEYMGVTTINEKMEIIGELLRDVPKYNTWIADCYGAQVEKKYDRNTMVIYMVLKPPIIEERDIILKDKAVYDWDNARANISFTATEEVRIPLEESRVRVTVMKGVFDMEYLGRDRTKFIYRLLVDPAGSIPKKVAYAVMRSYPYNTLKKLKALLPDKKYNDAARGTEEERAIETRTKNEAYIRKALAARLAKFVKEKVALQGIIAADRDNIRNIMANGGSYASIERATTNFFLMLADNYIVTGKEMLLKEKLNITGKEKIIKEKLSKDQDMIAEITDLIVSDCGAVDTLVEDIVVKYIKKYEK